jgi:hypothetical protein
MNPRTETCGRCFLVQSINGSTTTKIRVAPRNTYMKPLLHCHWEMDIESLETEIRRATASHLWGIRSGALWPVKWLRDHGLLQDFAFNASCSSAFLQLVRCFHLFERIQPKLTVILSSILSLPNARSSMCWVSRYSAEFIPCQLLTSPACRSSSAHVSCKLLATISSKSDLSSLLFMTLFVLVSVRRCFSLSTFGLLIMRHCTYIWARQVLYWIGIQWYTGGNTMTWMNSVCLLITDSVWDLVLILIPRV